MKLKVLAHYRSIDIKAANGGKTAVSRVEMIGKKVGAE